MLQEKTIDCSYSKLRHTVPHVKDWVCYLSDAFIVEAVVLDEQ